MARSLLFFLHMRHLVTTLILSLLLASPLWASPLGDSREVHESAKSDFGRLWAARSALDQAHEALAGEIETLKSARGAELAPDVQDGALDARLKRAKAMAAELGELDRRVTAARIAYAGARSALVTALESEILRLQVSLSEVNRDERLVRFERLRALVEERRTLPAAPVAKSAPVVLPAPPDGVVVSAEELQELVDETRDHAERVQAQLDQITARVDALRERRRLLRAAVDFHRDDALFAESERNRRVVTGAREGLPTVQGPVRTASTPEDDGSSGRVSPPEGESNDFDGAEAQASPGAPDEASPPAAEGDDGRGAPGSDAPEPERESDSQAGGSDPGSEPSLGSAVSEAPPSLPAVASPHQGGADGLGPGSDRMIRLGDAFDPSTLEGDVDDLSPAGVEQQIRALMARRGVLVEKRTALSSRRKDLERRAVDAQ